MESEAGTSCGKKDRVKQVCFRLITLISGRGRSECVYGFGVELEVNIVRSFDRCWLEGFRLLDLIFLKSRL